MPAKHWRNLGPVTVRSWHGNARTYASLEAAVLAIGEGYINDLTGATLRYDFSWDRVDVAGIRRWRPAFLDAVSYSSYARGPLIGGGDTHTFHDELGLRIPVDVVKRAFANTCRDDRRNNYGYYSRRDKHTKFRNGPIWGIRCFRGGNGMWKRMHTHAERRENDFVNYDEDCLDYDIEVRCARNSRSLPTAWDDRGRSDYGIKSWKRHRATQYKPK